MSEVINPTVPESRDGHDTSDHEGEIPQQKHQNSSSLYETHREIISKNSPSTELEIAYHADLERKEALINRLTREINKMRAFISKRKQTYKRKRKDEGAPTRALSAYNIFVQDRFSKLAKDNEEALKSSDVDAQLKRVPPASLVASTGNEWRELPAEEKKLYEEKAAADRKRYEDQMAEYEPPEKQKNKKRNKTGYNMFFSAHVLRLKQSDVGVPSERGSVARIVGSAWKGLSPEDKQYYEREAEKQNIKESGSDDDDTKVQIQRGSVQRPPLGPEMDAHNDRMGHRDGGMPHHNGAMMHPMMYGQPLHHGHPPHVSPQMGMTSHGYPPNPPPSQHHMGHQGQGYQGHQHQTAPYHPLPHSYRSQPPSHTPHYSQHHSSYHQGPLIM